jgi:hypothetical protein
MRAEARVEFKLILMSLLIGAIQVLAFKGKPQADRAQDQR